MVDFFRWFFKSQNINFFTLYIDSSVITRYGEQDGATKGYNPKKKGRKSHHPLIAFVNDIKMVAHFWLRSGNTNASHNFIGLLERDFSHVWQQKSRLGTTWQRFLLEGYIFDCLEEKSLPYIVAARFTHPIQHLIDKQDFWVKVDDGIEICDKTCQAQSWQKPRRIVIVR